MPSDLTVGRPTVMTAEVKQAILDRIVAGETVSRICRDDAMPSKAAVFRALAADEKFRDDYTRATSMRAEAWADEILDIAADDRKDVMPGKGVQGSTLVNGAAVQRSRLRVDAHKWLMAQMAPKKYGKAPVVEPDAPKADPSNPQGLLLVTYGPPRVHLADELLPPEK